MEIVYIMKISYGNIPIVMDASETWAPKEKEIRMLSIRKRKILSKIYGANKERNGKFGIIRNRGICMDNRT
jgi:hypothetical protein